MPNTLYGVLALVGAAIVGRLWIEAGKVRGYWR